MARLRSQGPAQEVMEAMSPTPSRKRRADSPSGSDTTSSVTLASGSLAPRTPGKSKKKVRFSDPGPDTVSSQSTGITPFVKRTSLAPGMDRPAPATPRLLARPPKRRASLPSLPKFAALGSASNPIDVHTFVPSRQCPTPRAQRQLKRQQVSEQMHAIETERRSVKKLQREVQDLKDRLDLATQLGQSASNEGVSSSQERIRELEDEIVQLKQEQPDESLQDIPMINDTDSVDLIPDCGYSTTSPAHTADDATTNWPSSPVSAQPSTGATTPALPSPTMVSSSVQTHITSQSIDTLHSFAISQNSHMTRARLSLERLFPGETAFGFSSTGDSKELLDGMLSRLSSSHKQLHKCKGLLDASKAQESNLRAKFDKNLVELGETKNAHAKLLAETQQRRATGLEQADSRIKQLESEVKDYESSHEKLTAALDKYREDVQGLQTLIQGLEIEHAGTIEKMKVEEHNAMKQLKEQTGEAISDLECQVAAETRGRREAESEIDEMSLRVKESKNREREVREALNQKQSIVRELESTMESMKQIWEQEIGGLNARVGQLCAEVEGKKAELKRAEVEITRLIDCVNEENQAGRNSIEKMKAEIRKCNDGVAKIDSEFERGATERSEQVITALGLLTPSVEGGRFRDIEMTDADESIEGHVEVARGKAAKRRIGRSIGQVMEEDEE